MSSWTSSPHEIQRKATMLESVLTLILLNQCLGIYLLTLAMTSKNYFCLMKGFGKFVLYVVTLAIFLMLVQKPLPCLEFVVAQMDNTSIDINAPGQARTTTSDCYMSYQKENLDLEALLGELPAKPNPTPLPR